MIATLDGRAAANGSPAGLGSPTDQRLMRLLRAEADATLHGAGTLRADRFSPRVPEDLETLRVSRGLSRQPVGVVLTLRGRLSPEHPYFTSATDDWPRLVYTPGAAEHLRRPGVDVVKMDGTGLRQVAEDLVRRGIRTVICEGGPTLNHALLDGGLVDELFLTLAPRLVAGADPLTIVVGDSLNLPPLELRSAFERDGELLLRYAVR